MKVPELDGLFRELFSSKRRLRYGISVTNAAPDLSTIDVEFRFLTAQSYCCAEPGCHLPRDCNRLVRLAAERSIRLPDDVVVRWHCLVEEGAHVLCRRDFGCPVETEAYEFDFVSGGPSIGDKAPTVPQKPPAYFTGLWIVDAHDGARTETEYLDGVPNGRFRYLLKGGVCLREGFMKDGQRHGTLITRNSDGTVLDESEFAEGTGTYRIFNSKGRLTDEVPLRHGKPHGAAKSWRQGKVAVIVQYVDGERIAASVSPSSVPRSQGPPDR